MTDKNEPEQMAAENDYRLVWTFDDVARELQCSKRLVEKLVQKDRIPHAKVGRLVRFSPARIKEWIEKEGRDECLMHH